MDEEGNSIITLSHSAPHYNKEIVEVEVRE